LTGQVAAPNWGAKPEMVLSVKDSLRRSRFISRSVSIANTVAGGANMERDRDDLQSIRNPPIVPTEENHARLLIRAGLDGLPAVGALARARQRRLLDRSGSPLI